MLEFSTPKSKSLPQTGFVRLPTVLHFIPVSRSTWWRGIKGGKFPAPIHLGPRAVAWRVEDICALIARLTAGEQI